MRYDGSYSDSMAREMRLLRDECERAWAEVRRLKNSQARVEELEKVPDFVIEFSKVVTKTPGCIDQPSHIFRLDGWKDAYSVYVPDHVAISFGFRTFAVEFNMEKAAGLNIWLIPAGELGRCLAASRLYPVVGGASGRYEHLGDKPYTHEDEPMPKGAEAYYRSIVGTQ